MRRPRNVSVRGGRTPSAVEDNNSRERDKELLEVLQRLNTITLDVHSRLVILETSGKFADLARQELQMTIKELTGKLEPIFGMTRAVEGLNREVEELKEVVREHQGIVLQVKGGMRLTGVLWAAVLGMSSIVSAVVAVIVKFLT